MPTSPALIIFGVQSVVKLGMAAQKAYEQYVRDKEVSLPMLPVGSSDRLLAEEFFRQPEMQMWVTDSDGLGKHWVPGANPVVTGKIKAGPGHEIAIVDKWRKLAPRSAPGLSRGIASIEYTMVRQWAAQDPHKPARPETRLILALADVALDFVSALPTLLASTGASQPVLKAIAVLAAETRGVFPDLSDPEAWKGKKWLGANFGQSLLVAAFRAGLATLAKHPELVVDEDHVQRLIAATIIPLKQAFDQAEKDAGDNPGKVINALLLGERLRDELLPGMVAAALRSVAADRNAFLSSIVRPVDGNRTEKLIAALANGVLDEAAKLKAGELLERDTWLDFFRAGVAVIASQPELVVRGNNDDENAKALKQLVADVGVALAAGLGKPGRLLVIGIATAALDSAHSSLPMLLLPKDQWDGVAAALARSVIEGIKPALESDNPALLQRLASREQIAQMVSIVLKEVATTPALVIGNHASAEAQAVLAAMAVTMAAKGADLLHAEGWLAVTAAAAEAAAANPGRLFRLAGGADTAIGAKLIGIALTQASISLKGAEDGKEAPFLAGALLQDTIVALLKLAARKRLADKQVDRLSELLAGLVAEARKPDGQILPSQIAVVVTFAGAALLDEKVKLEGAFPTNELIKIAVTQIG
jgi:hypothetical protein